MSDNSDVECFPEEEEVKDSSPFRSTISVSLMAEHRFYIPIAWVRFLHGEPMDDIIQKIDDLIIQATKERSYFYVKSVLEEARVEIQKLREKAWKYDELCK